MIVVGAKEAQTGQVNLRMLNGEQIIFENVEDALDHIVKACRPPDVSDPIDAIKASISALKATPSVTSEEQ